jgi:hypothetical protein
VRDHGGADAGGDWGYDGEGAEEEIGARAAHLKNSKAVPVYGGGLFIDSLCVCRLLEAPAAKAVEAKVAAIPVKVMAVEPEVAAIVANFHAVVADVPAVGEGCLSLGSNSGEEETDGEHYGKFRFHTISFYLL